jgi:hypothetical protein
MAPARGAGAAICFAAASTTEPPAPATTSHDCHASDHDPKKSRAWSIVSPSARSSARARGIRAAARHGAPCAAVPSPVTRGRFARGHPSITRA